MGAEDEKTTTLIHRRLLHIKIENEQILPMVEPVDANTSGGKKVAELCPFGVARATGVFQVSGQSGFAGNRSKAGGPGYTKWAQFGHFFPAGLNWLVF